ncbi:MAG: glycosyltransferase [Atribacterota bacterium]
MNNFICFSINNWEKRKARKQQFMLALSNRDDVDKVLYIEPPLNFWRLIFFSLKELSSTENKNRWSRGLKGKKEKINNNLFIYIPIFFIPFFHRIQWIYNINRFFSYLKIKKLLKKMDMKNNVLWLYHPYDYKLLKWFKERKISIFDWAEEWADYFIEFGKRKRKKIKRLEALIIKGADIVFTVSEDLKKKAKLLNSNSYHLFDGTTYEVFQKENYTSSQDIKNIPKSIAGYLGTINERIDVKLITKTAEELPGVSFVFIGAIHKKRTNISELKKFDNINFLGEKEFEKLGDYTNYFDVCILPYKTNLFMGFPTKLLDYLATGKPVVSTKLKHLKKVIDYINIAESDEEFIESIKRALKEENEERSKKRLMAAKENTWDKRAEQIMTIIKRYE